MKAQARSARAGAVPEAPTEEARAISLLLAAARAAFLFSQKTQEVLAAAVGRTRLGNVSGLHFSVLFTIASLPPATATSTHLERLLGSSTRRSIKELIERGYVATQRSPSDQRSVILQLTPPALGAVSEATAFLGEILTRRVPTERASEHLESLSERLADAHRDLGIDFIG